MNEWMNQLMNDRATQGLLKNQKVVIISLKVCIAKNYLYGSKDCTQDYLKIQGEGCTFKQKDMVVEVVWHPSLPEYKWLILYN